MTVLPFFDKFQNKKTLSADLRSLNQTTDFHWSIVNTLCVKPLWIFSAKLAKKACFTQFTKNSWYGDVPHHFNTDAFIWSVQRLLTVYFWSW